MENLVRLNRNELRRLALAGAEVRLNELRTEEIRLSGIVKLLTDKAELASHAVRNTPAEWPKGKRLMSDAQRAAVSRRMKKFWAKRRRERKAAAAEAK